MSANVQAVVDNKSLPFLSAIQSLCPHCMADVVMLVLPGIEIIADPPRAEGKFIKCHFIHLCKAADARAELLKSYRVRGLGSLVDQALMSAG